MEKIELLTVILLLGLLFSPIYFLNLITIETVIQIGSTLWFQLISIFGITAIVIYSGEVFKWIDIKLAYVLTGIFDQWFERKLRARHTLINSTWIKPDASIKIDRDKIGHITRVTALEVWMTHYPIDYTFFFDYHIDYKESQAALSRVLSKLPIIGGVWRKIDDEKLGIDHSNPCIEYYVCSTDLIPSTQDKDFGNENWYGKFMKGYNHKFPYPEGSHVFRVTHIYYKNEEENKDCTLLCIGCAHALTDGEGFFMLMRGWANEMNNKEWIIPSFDRSLSIIKDSELKKFKLDKVLNGKHFDYTVRPTPWMITAMWPSRRWVPKTWIFTKQDIAALKQKALNGTHGEQLKSMRLSTNDIIVALFWKVRALLNRDYEYNHPTICSIALNTRKWIPNRFPKDVPYFGNGLAFVLLSKSRGELINASFSEVCYMVRKTVSLLKSSDFDDELHFYPYVLKYSPDGVDTLHRYHTRWAVPGFGYEYGRYLMDRDITTSNLIKLDTLNFNMGNGNPSRVRFYFQDEANQMGYAFKLDEKINKFEYYGIIPTDDIEFFNKYDITKADIDWEWLKNNYATQTKRWARKFPGRRLPLLKPSALFDGRPDTQFWNW